MADLTFIRDSRLPLLLALSAEDGSRRDALALEALPLYTSVSALDAQGFRDKLRECASTGDIDALLTLIRDSFTEFRYDDFPQLEGHYQDVLALMAALLGAYLDKWDFRPGVVEWILFTPKGKIHIIFNLRGTAEEASSKITFPTDAPRIGVSFSAFDRTIDRWIQLD